MRFLYISFERKEKHKEKIVMMRKMKKYLLMFLTVLLCITGFSVQISADDEEPEGDQTYTAAYGFVMEDESEVPESVMELHITCENQRAFDERWPIFKDIPAKHKGMNLAPLLGGIDISPALASGQIEFVGVLYGYGDREELTKAGATYIIQTVSEIKKYIR